MGLFAPGSKTVPAALKNKLVELNIQSKRKLTSLGAMIAVSISIPT